MTPENRRDLEATLRQILPGNDAQKTSYLLYIERHFPPYWQMLTGCDSKQRDLIGIHERRQAKIQHLRKTAAAFAKAAADLDNDVASLSYPFDMLVPETLSAAWLQIREAATTAQELSAAALNEIEEDQARRREVKSRYSGQDFAIRLLASEYAGRFGERPSYSRSGIFFAVISAVFEAIGMTEKVQERRLKTILNGLHSSAPSPKRGRKPKRHKT